MPLAVPFGDGGALDEVGPVPLLLAALPQVPAVLRQGLLRGLRADLLPAIGRMLLALAPALREPLFIEPPVQSANPLPLLFLRLLRYALPGG
jgi:hypothetical protein